MPEKTVSIAMYTRNGERFLGEQLSSFLSQVSQPTELIVYDDYSTDATPNILEEYASKSPFPVKILLAPAFSGMSEGLERAIRECLGDVIVLSDQEDVWQPTRIEAMMSVFRSNPDIGLVCSDAEIVDEDMIPLSCTVWEAQEFSVGADPRLILDKEYILGPILAFKRQILDQILPIPKDVVPSCWIAYSAAKCSRIGFTTEIAIQYRLHPRRLFPVHIPFRPSLAHEPLRLLVKCIRSVFRPFKTLRPRRAEESSENAGIQISKRESPMPENAPALAKEGICAVFVTFHPDMKIWERISSILSQVARVVIVDNGSDKDEVAHLRSLTENSLVELILNEENLGVATALNQGVNRAREAGYSWALLFDQDTLAYESMVQEFAQIYGAVESKGRVAVIGANYWDGKLYGIQPFVGFRGRIWKESDFVITSGSLLSITVFEKVGPFREEFFVDAVDMEYCFRARQEGFIILSARGPLMEHSVGSPVVCKIGGRTYMVTKHAPLRRYYMIRNCAILQKEYRQTFPSVAEFAKRNNREIFKVVLLFEKQKMAKIRMMFLGYLDAHRDRLGRRADSRVR